MNPGGTASWGFTIRENGTEIHSASGVIGTGPTMTSNVAEIVACTELLKAIIEKYPQATSVLIQGDSTIIIRQMNGRGKKNPQGHYAPYLPAAHGLAVLLRARCPAVEFRWIPREENGRADELSKVGQPYLGREARWNQRRAVDYEYRERLERED